MSHVAGAVMAGQLGSQYCPNCQCGGCVIHRDRVEQQKALHQSYRPVFQSDPVFGRGLADAFISQQNAMNAAIRNEPHPAVQVDQRSWLERRILYVIGGLIAIGLIGEYMPWAT